MSQGNSKSQSEQSEVTKHSPLLVLGVGNILLRDEGVGVHVVKAMEGMQLSHEIKLIDGGTAALDLLDVITNHSRVIIVDAVSAGSEPGTLYRFTLDDLPIKVMAISSLHQVDLLETLKMARHLGWAPEKVIIFGIEPKEVTWGLGLSPEVADVVPKVIELVIAEL